MNTVKNIIAAILLLSMPAILIADESKKRELTFLTWSEYIDPELVEKFEKQFNAKVRMIYYDSDDQRDDILVETDGAGYDVILSSDLGIFYYMKSGWLAPVTEKQVPNLKYIDSKWIDPVAKAKGYSMPYFWGTLGIAYRKDLIDFEVNSWKQLFEPDPEVHKKIIMLDGANDVLGMALKSLGYSANSTDRKKINEAKKLLQEQKKHVHAYTVTVLDEESPLVKGEAYMAMAYSGDTLVIKEISPNIEYVLPKEGGNLWIDFMVVGSKSKNKQLAYDFINYLNIPDIAAQNAQFVYYATPNRAAEKLLPKDFLRDPVIYPSKQSLNRSEAHKPLPPRIQKMKNDIYTNLVD